MKNTYNKSTYKPRKNYLKKGFRIYGIITLIAWLTCMLSGRISGMYISMFLMWVWLGFEIWIMDRKSKN